MILKLICLAICLNGFLIYFTSDLLFYTLCILESILIALLAYRLIRLSSRKQVKRLASLTYCKMEIYYKKHLNSAMAASSKFEFCLIF